MALKGDFIGFTFNGIHSSIMGIVRTSNGSRYNHNLLPNSQDQTVAVPGGDGVYFFGSNYTTRVFQLQIASDELTEVRMSAIRQWLGDKQIHELIFDEVPYKVYMGKCTNMPQFNFICFGETGERIYKGEGSIEFTCYYPYARSRFKFLNSYTKGELFEWAEDGQIIDNSKSLHNHVLIEQDAAAQFKVNGYVNKDEWADASGMIKNNHGDDSIHSLGYLQWPKDYSSNITAATVEGDFNKMKPNLYVQNGSAYDNLDSGAQFSTYFSISGESIVYKIPVYYKRLYDTPQWTRGGNAYSRVFVYNPGDIPADYQLLFRSHKDVNRLYFYKEQKNAENKTERIVLYTMYFDFTEPGLPNFMMLDSKTELLTGYNYDSELEQYVPDNKIYNKCITKGDFFKIPLTIPNECYNMRFVLGVVSTSTEDKYKMPQIKKITYNYLYY